MTHGARTRPDDEQALYTPAAADFSGVSRQQLYVWRRKTIQTGIQHGPRFGCDGHGRPFYTRGWLLDFRVEQAVAIATAKKARKARKQ